MGVATTTTSCVWDLMSPATFQAMTTASGVMGKSVHLDVGGWNKMATVLTNTQSVVMVEEIPSVDATLTLTVPTQSTQSAMQPAMNARQSPARFSSTRSRSTHRPAPGALQLTK